MSIPVMESEDEAAALAAELRKRTAERDELATIGAALAKRLKQTPDVRAIVGELKHIYDSIQLGLRDQAIRDLAMLLRRLDESQ